MFCKGFNRSHMQGYTVCMCLDFIVMCSNFNSWSRRLHLTLQPAELYWLPASTENLEMDHRIFWVCQDSRSINQMKMASLLLMNFILVKVIMSAWYFPLQN